MLRRAAILTLVLAAAVYAGGATRPLSARERAVARLLALQSKDGGWHGERYSVFRTGQALTPYVLLAIFDLAPREQRERALEFIRKHASGPGALGMDDPELPEYPTYATAYALRCLVKANRPEDAALRRRLEAWLVSRQFQESNGYGPDHVAHGGFGFGGRPPSPRFAGHMDLAHTRRALEALRAAGHDDPATWRRAEKFLRVLQRPDGGFYFSPTVLQANKGRQTPEGEWRSYATATCDGVLALLACGVGREDARVQAAKAWLVAHARLDRPEGIPSDHPEPWPEALDLYHQAVRAEAYAALGLDLSAIRERLTKRQLIDGGFINVESPLMKEDEPALATTLGLLGLT